MPCVVEHRLVVLARVRAALVGVMQQAGIGTPPLQCHLERLQREMSIIHGTDGPADDEARIQVENGRQIELAAAADDELRRIADPALIGRLRCESTVEQIGRDRVGRDRSSSCA